MASGQPRPPRCRPAPAATTSTASWLVATGRGLRPGAWRPHGTTSRWAPTTPSTRPTSPPISAGAASSAVTIAVLVAVPSLVDSGNIVVPMNPGAGGNDGRGNLEDEEVHRRPRRARGPRLPGADRGVRRPPLGLSDVRRHEPPHQGGPLRRGRGHHQRGRLHREDAGRSAPLHLVTVIFRRRLRLRSGLWSVSVRC